MGACRFEGFVRCIEGNPEETCTPREPTIDDSICDGVDSDCDGIVDEDYVEQILYCGFGVCHNSGVSKCLDGEVIDECTALQPQGLDQECDNVDFKLLPERDAGKGGISEFSQCSLG